MLTSDLSLLRFFVLRCNSLACTEQEATISFQCSVPLDVVDAIHSVFRH